MNKTKIEWVKNPDGTQGYTWNPITGCLNGCEYCYARKLAHGRLKSRYLGISHRASFEQSTNNAKPEDLLDPFYPRLWPERLEEPMVKAVTRGRTTVINVGKEKGIFICDMSDLFGIGIPEGWTKKVMQTIEDSPHRFYLLTKQPQNLIKWSPFPLNCYVGVTVCTNGMMTNALVSLARIVASKTFISFEPLLGQIGMNDHMNMRGIVDWVIIGAQTKPYKPPRIEWVEEIVRACDKAGIPVFLKDNLFPLFKDKMSYLNKGWLRQEMPG